MTTVLIILIAVFIDALLGEPKKWHPIAGFGMLATRIESLLLNLSTTSGATQQRIIGLIAWCVLVLPLSYLAWYLSHLGTAWYWIVSIVLLYTSLGNYSLVQHAQTVMYALQANNLDYARNRVAFMVSRDTQSMQEVDIRTATIESVLENGCDAVFGAIFWFVLLGVPGVVMYRLANTLDAMWGYRTPRYKYFGWATARIDDILNWLPAQLTALSYALMGNVVNGVKAWFTQARYWKSINAGSVMASGAGALKLQLGGAAIYNGVSQQRPRLGFGNTPKTQDIQRSIRLVQRSLWLWLVSIFIGGALVYGPWW